MYPDDGRQNERGCQWWHAMNGSIPTLWRGAITSTDGTWMTRVFHRKNTTFSVRNYFNGALLYHNHLCQSGSNKGVKSSTRALPRVLRVCRTLDCKTRYSHSVAGYQTTLLQMQWQSTSPMLKSCRKGSQEAAQIGKYSKSFPSVGVVVYHCSRHRSGCGCLSSLNRLGTTSLSLCPKASWLKSLQPKWRLWPGMHMSMNGTTESVTLPS